MWVVGPYSKNLCVPLCLLNRTCCPSPMNIGCSVNGVWACLFAGHISFAARFSMTFKA